MSHRPWPDLIWERYRLGELPPDALEALRARCAESPDLRARLEALERSDRAILEAYPPEAMARALSARRAAAATPGEGLPASGASLPRSGVPRVPRAGIFRAPRPGSASRSGRKAFWAVPAGLALACLVLLAVRRPDPGNAAVTEGAEAYAVRLKGAEAGLAIFRKARGGAELLPPHSLAKPGDTLQVFYHCRGPAYGAIFSVDGSGAVTLHFPEEGGTAASLQAGDLLPLPHAYRLDRAPRLERFFLVTAPKPFAVENVLERARATFAARREVPDSLEGLDAGFRQYPYTLRKPGKAGGAK